MSEEIYNLETDIIKLEKDLFLKRKEYDQYIQQHKLNLKKIRIENINFQFETWAWLIFLDSDPVLSLHNQLWRSHFKYSEKISIENFNPRDSSALKSYIIDKCIDLSLNDIFLKNKVLEIIKDNKISYKLNIPVIFEIYGDFKALEIYNYLIIKK